MHVDPFGTQPNDSTPATSHTGASPNDAQDSMEIPTSSRQRYPKARRWCFTINNPTETPEQLIIKILSVTDKYVFQLERGENGTTHYQGYLETNGVRLSTLKRVSDRAHWEPAKGNRHDNYRYCTKEPRVDGPWSTIRPQNLAGQGRRSDLDAAIDLVKRGGTLRELVDRFPVEFVKFNRGLRDMQSVVASVRELNVPPIVEWHYGKAGTGKSTQAYRSAASDGRFYAKNNSKWWDGYSGELTTIWDEFAGSYPFRDLLTALDKFACCVESKGGTAQLMSNKFIFTSNNPPWKFYQVADANNQITMEALLRRITAYIYYISFDEVHVYENVDDAKANFFCTD